MRIMVFGTFDNFHPGHLNYFQQARCFGEKTGKGEAELIAIVARDKNVLRIKGRRSQEDEKKRIKKVRAALKEIGNDQAVSLGQTIRKKTFSSRAVLGAVKNQWLVLKKYQPEIICLGYDQKVDLQKLKDEIAKFRLCCKIKRMGPYYPEKYKSSHCLGEY